MLDPTQCLIQWKKSHNDDGQEHHDGQPPCGAHHDSPHFRAIAFPERCPPFLHARSWNIDGYSWGIASLYIDRLPETWSSRGVRMNGKFLKGGPGMRVSKFSEQQIVAVLRQAEGGTSVVEVCRKLGITVQTF